MSQSPNSHGSIEFRHHAGSAVVSIQTSGGTLPPSVELESKNGAGGGTIIIHEFLDNGETHGPQQQQNHHLHHHHPHPGGCKSITILTPPTTTSASSAVSHINICINNHFSGSGHITLDSEMPHLETRSEPRRQKRQFGLSDDVLVRCEKDDRFYLGTIIAIGEHNCLVRFDDSTERWSAFEQLKKLGGDEEEAIGDGASKLTAKKDAATCVVCKEHDIQQIVEVCENCRRGYHLQCLRSQTGNGNIVKTEPENGPWICGRCATSTDTSPPYGAERLTNGFSWSGLSDELAALTDKSQLPYELDALDWDESHQVNTAGQYCYCGEDGDWAKEMIQCWWCNQWFHGRCIRSLQYPIFLGDPFYLFLCSICNHGHEFVRRLELCWSDLAHLALYNLIMRSGRRLYNFGRSIIPYIEDNFRTLQVPEQLKNLPFATRKEMINQALKSNKQRFANGVEFNKSSRLWTLRNHKPPPCTKIDIPRGQIVTENMLHKLTAKSTIRFLPRLYLERSFVTDAASHERMTGIKYSQPPFSEEDPRPEASVLVVNGNAGSHMGKVLVAHVKHKIPGLTSGLRADEEIASNGESSVSNLTTVGAVACLPAQPSRNRRKYRAGDVRIIRREPDFDTYDSSDSASTRLSSTLDALIPPPKDFKGKNNPFYNDPNSVVQRPRQARIVKCRLNAKDISNSRPAKKRMLNNGSSQVVASGLPIVIPFCDTLVNQHKPFSTFLDFQLDQSAGAGPTCKTPASNGAGSSAAVSPTVTASTSPPKKHTYQSRRLRPRTTTDYRVNRQYRRRGYRSDSADYEPTSCQDSNGMLTPRPLSSLSSSDTLESSSLSTNGGGNVMQTLEQRLTSNGDAKKHRGRRMIFTRHPSLCGIRILPDGQREYLLQE